MQHDDLLTRLQSEHQRAVERIRHFAGLVLDLNQSRPLREGYEHELQVAREEEQRLRFLINPCGSR